MKLIFVDTGAFFALADRNDPAHPRARRFYESYKGTFLTTDFIFAETMSLLTKRLDKRTAVRFGKGIREGSRFRVEEPSREVKEAAWELFATQVDKDYDLVDCLSFAFMDALDLRDVFGFDRHFAQHGLRLLPE